MKNDLFLITKKFIKESFGDTNMQSQIKHLLRTAYWVKFLYPKANEALLVAAISHDIDKVFRKPGYYENMVRSNKGFLKKESIIEHPKRCSKIMEGFLKRNKVKKELIFKIKDFIEKYEIGGNKEQNILKDANSLSFFENNVDVFLSLKKWGSNKQNIRDKFDWMYSRITSRKAKSIAKPWYEKAIKLLIKS